MRRHMASSARPLLRGVVFDLDGTLTVPNLDFREMHERCGVPMGKDLLAAVRQMEPEHQQAAWNVIEEMEDEGRRTLELAEGALDLGRWLQRHRLPTAMVTRNSASTVQWMHDKLWGAAGLPCFHPALSRDDVEHDKPHPAALEAIAKEWGHQLGPELLMVGDSPSNDIGFGKAAGISTALVDPGRRFRTGDSGYGADFVIDSLLELPHLLWKSFDIPGPLGSTAQTLHGMPDPLPETAACRAAVDGDVTALKAMTREDLRAADPSGNTPLVWAADAGNADVVESLLAVGVEVNVKGYLGNTAVSRACRRGHGSVLRVLLGAGIGTDLDEPNDKMQSPLHFAAFKQNMEAVQLMLAAGASTTSLDRKGRTPAEDTSDPVIRDLILQARAAT
ncbi:unnamed protein product [Symbiodinium natans]|uniref:Uncharacterized protein n=1 Tax=Symbiodinium natans TaxID=878477 RepID=A0A812UFZ8_9DINO|nr:unnamed protein product [Symbiodinium natans]